MPQEVLCSARWCELSTRDVPVPSKYSSVVRSPCPNGVCCGGKVSPPTSTTEWLIQVHVAFRTGFRFFLDIGACQHQVLLFRPAEANEHSGSLSGPDWGRDYLWNQNVGKYYCVSARDFANGPQQLRPVIIEDFRPPVRRAHRSTFSSTSTSVRGRRRVRGTISSKTISDRTRSRSLSIPRRSCRS